jgi:ABC-2 type transport system permease protein
MEPKESKRVSTFSHIGTMTKYNFLNYFRSRRFYVMLVIVLLISVLLTAAIGYYRPMRFVTTSLGFYEAGWGGFASFVVILSTAFFGGDAISGEFQNKTGYYLVPNPIRRSAIYIGKWLAALAASTLILATFAVIMIANGAYYFPTAPFPSQFLQSVLFAWIYLVAALSLAFAFSSLFKSSSISILMSVILLLFVFSVIDTVSSSVIGIEPQFSITYGAGIVTSVLNATYPAHIQTTHFGGARGGGFTLTTYYATIPEGLAILVTYFVVTAVLGLWLFERKEFTS